jgi:hypothetical protein
LEISTDGLLAGCIYNMRERRVLAGQRAKQDKTSVDEVDTPAGEGESALIKI